MSPLIGETPIFTAAAVDPARGALRLVVVAIAPAGGAIAEIFDQVIEKKFSDSDGILFLGSSIEYAYLEEIIVDRLRKDPIFVSFDVFSLPYCLFEFSSLPCCYSCGLLQITIFMLCGGKLSEGIIIGSLLSMLSAVVVSLPQYPDIGQVNSLHGQVTIGTLRQQEVGNLGNVGGKDLSRTLYLITRTTLFIRGRRVGNKWEKDGALWSGPSIPSHGSNEREEPHGAKSAIYLRCRLSSCSCRRRLMHSSHQFETLTRISSPSSPVCRRRRRDRGDGSRGGRRGRRLPSLKNVSEHSRTYKASLKGEFLSIDIITLQHHPPDCLILIQELNYSDSTWLPHIQFSLEGTW
ncbi:hypothetical protein MUK42_21412 [Musa troglodytarum]|uniref:Uncharacterized protein n=1 Tax=Musa troglodytarum TaxID=320322 RepID=A0A9E7G7D1_9LILI|nr:hypothetical protein MUK42_21412 [Musa troglodytarum]